MDKYTTKSTYDELLNELDSITFTKLINIIDIDKYVKKLTAYKFLQLIMYAQLKELKSLTHLSGRLKNEEELQTHIEFDAISTSQLSRKLGNMSPELFEKLFHHLVRSIQMQMKTAPITQKIRRLHAIDSTTISMSIGQYPWATFRKTKSGVRVHLKVLVTKDFTIPVDGIMLPAKHADRTQMSELIEMDPDTINLFDRGYTDYKQFDVLCRLNVRFITKMKKNAQIEVLSEQQPNSDIIFKDQDVILGNGRTKMEHTLRLVHTVDREGNPVVIVTNCFDLSAEEISELYRYRWKIETFFKWIKQHLRVKTFYGQSQNAVYNQLWIALITYCLQVLLQLKVGHKDSLLKLQRSLQDTLFKPFDAFIRSLFYQPTRESKGRKKYDWEAEFEIIQRQFEEGQVEHLDNLEYDPVFLQ
jgi:IS4 transposase